MKRRLKNATKWGKKRDRKKDESEIDRQKEIKRQRGKKRKQEKGMEKREIKVEEERYD